MAFPFTGEGKKNKISAITSLADGFRAKIHIHISLTSGSALSLIEWTHWLSYWRSPHKFSPSSKIPAAPGDPPSLPVTPVPAALLYLRELWHSGVTRCSYISSKGPKLRRWHAVSKSLGHSGADHSKWCDVLPLRNLHFLYYSSICFHVEMPGSDLNT